MRVAGIWLMAGVVTGVVMGVAPMVAQTAGDAGPYKVLAKSKVGGEGGFDYVYADSEGRKLYVPRPGEAGVVKVYDLDSPGDSLKEVGSITGNARGVAVDQKSHHGFASSKPVAMWDTRTLKMIKTIEVEGGPDGIMADEFNGRVWVFSHGAPNATVIDAQDGSVVGTVDLGGAPEQAISDGKGHVYVDIEDKGNVAVVDAKTLKVTAHYDLKGKGGTCAGLAMDRKNGYLFATCRDPQMMVVLKAADGAIVEALPIGKGTDGAAFNPETMEAFSSQGDGTLTVVKEDAGKFVVEQNLTTMTRAKTLTLDAKTGKVMLIGAEFGVAPEAKPGERPGRPPMVPGSFTILTVGK